MSKLDLHDRGHALEEAFFRKEQARLVESLREQKQRAEATAELRTATGISDEELLGSLVDHGVNTATLAAFALVPLVFVAWASGTVEDRERDAILQAASENGIDTGGPAHEFLQHLLAGEPAPAMVERWEAFVTALRDSLGEEAFAPIGRDISARALRVAEAAGGILGLGSVSSDESAALSRIEAALH